jgi:adenylate kinase
MLAKKLGVIHLVSGDMVRKYAKEDKGIIGEVVRESLDKGYYVPDSEMYVMWKKRFKEDDAKEGWVLDGFPRNLTQAKFLERKVEKYEKELDVVFFLDVSEKESVSRLVKRGRRNPDGELHDSPERIKERLKHYNKGKKPVLNYYKKRGILVRIDGERSINLIHKDILGRVRKIMSSVEK